MAALVVDERVWTPHDVSYVHAFALILDMYHVFTCIYVWDTSHVFVCT